MKTINVRVPDAVVADVEREARRRRMSKSDILRERLARPSEPDADPLADIRDLIGSIKDDDLPTDLSARKKHYLKVMGFGQKRHR